jgi:hypothetical protein
MAGRQASGANDMTAINRPGPEEDAQPGIGGDIAARLRLVARGDADAFDAVYDLLAPSVFGIVRQVVRDLAQVRPIAGITAETPRSTEVSPAPVSPDTHVPCCVMREGVQDWAG